MAILAEQVYTIIKNELFDNNIKAYSDYIPDKTTYPFCMYEIVNTTSDPDWAFATDYELLTVRFNVYDNNVNPINAINLQVKIEGIFNRIKLDFVDETEGKYLMCNYKINDKIEYLQEDSFWLATVDYEFRGQRDI